MKTWKLIICYCAISLAFCPLDASEVVVQARASYEGAVKTIKARYDHRISIWPSEYKKKCSALEATIQKAGNLEPLLLVQNEQKRFSTSGSIPEDALVEDLPSLRAIQDKFRELKETFSTEKHRDILALVSKYEAHLKSKQSELTRASRMEDAIACRDEIARLQAAPEVTAARFVMTIETEVAPEEPKTAAAKEPVVEKPALAKIKGFGSNYFTIHAQGGFPPRPTSGVFKRISTRSSPLIKTRTIAVTVTVNTETDPTRENGGTRLRSNGEVTTARLQLKMASTSAVVTKPTLQVQYFAVSPSRRVGSRKAPFEMSHHTVQLPHLSGKPLSIDCPAAGKPPRSRRSPSVNYYKHYGIIVSIFDASGKLVAQDAFPALLAERARNSAPRTD